jgi:hypothetical protein
MRKEYTIPIERKNGVTNVSITVDSVDGLPTNAYFTEHAYDRRSRESTDCVLAKRGGELSISDDLGDSWSSLHLDDVRNIRNTFCCDDGTIIVSGVDVHDPTSNRIVVLKDGLELASNIVGMHGWHATFSIDEADGCMMFAEYPANKSNQDVKHPAHVFRSTDGGLSWHVVFRVDYPESRHFHTCTAIHGTSGQWIITSGDTPEQCRFWMTNDDGDTWQEITDPEPAVHGVSERNKQSIHRTVVMHCDEEYLLWATDDPMGLASAYHVSSTEMYVRSRLVRAKRQTPISVEVMCDIGMHVRSMVDVGSAFVIVTEAKYVDVVPNPQVFIVFKDETGRCHHLFDIDNVEKKSTGATYSKSSIASKDGVFFTLIERGLFADDISGILRWKIEFD